MYTNTVYPKMSEPTSITAVVLTKDEVDNITRCLKSLLWCEEIILVDDSKDKTLELARTIVSDKKLRIIKQSSTSDFAALRNMALKQARHVWVLFVDADEEVTPGLAREIKEAICDEGENGYFLKRRDHFLGRWLKFGETAEVRLLKLGRKDAGKWVRRVHEKWEITNPTGELVSPLLHYPHPTVAEFIVRINRWTTLDAQEFYDQGVRSNWAKILIFPLGKFLRNYFIKLGFLDGLPGLIMAINMSFHSFLTRAKLYLLQTS